MYEGKKHRIRSLLARILIVVMTITSIVQTDSVLAATNSKVKSIKITKPAIKTLALKRGETYKLNCTVRPAKTKNKLMFSSSKKSVVNVSKKGVLKARKTGKATIIVTSKTKPVKRAKINVTVYKRFKKVKKVSLNKASATLNEGQSLTLKVAISPKKATVKKVTYVTSDRSVVTVTQKGVVTAGKIGTAAITAYAKDGRGAKAVCKVTVKKTDDTVRSGETAIPVSSDGNVQKTPSKEPDPTHILEPLSTPATSVLPGHPSTPSTSAEPGLPSTPAASPLPVQGKELPKFTWNCLGDSITANAYVDHHYYDYIKDRNKKIQINNYGISGTKMAGTASGAFCNRYTEMDKNADLITVFGGVNDWGQRSNGGPTPLGTKDDTTNKTFYGALNILCAGLQETYPDAVILFMTPLGNEGYPGFSTTTNSLGYTVEDYVEVICEVCEKYNIPVVDLYHESGISPYDRVQNAVYFHDGLHLSNAGHERIGYLIENAIWKYYVEKLNDEIQDKKVVDLFLFMGQSNMAGRGITTNTWKEEAATIREGAGYEFRAISDPTKLYQMTEPFGINENQADGINDGNKKTGSMVTAFTNAYSKYTGVPVVGVSASEGGTSIDQWQPDGKRLTDAISRYRAAVKWLEDNGYTIRNRCMLWCQGESDGDSNMSAETYQAKFNRMLDRMKGEQIETCYMVRIGKYNGSNQSTDYSGIMEAQTELAEKNQNVVLVSKDMAGLKERKLMKDAYHYYQKAYNEVGYQAGVISAYHVLTGRKPSLRDPKDDTAEKDTETPHATAAPITEQPYEDKFVLASDKKSALLYVDENGEDYDGLSLIAESFAGDVALVTDTGLYSGIVSSSGELKSSAIIVGSIGNNDVIDALIEDGKLDVSGIKGKWETYKIQVVENPTAEVDKAIVVVGSDKRGAIYGLYHISEKIGVSPWVYWGDVTPKIQEEIILEDADLAITSKEPSVRYRGIFLNDEAPSLTGWVKNKFGNYNEDFYQLVYELILRCKGNYLWPAMWSNVFSEDGKKTPIANAELADKYGIVMGTSHHEPLCRAGEEWQKVCQKYGTSNLWDYSSNGMAITNFWKDGVSRNKAFENVYTLGMRGESDSPLLKDGTIEENVSLLKNVITAQKQILADHDLSESPQVLTVYKEVENYWHGTEEVSGLKDWDVLDDVTIMLCDDNFGNLRTLPATKEERERKGGWGMYYHFDYHGGPTSYEWINTVELNKVWEQMSMAYEHGVDDIWIVNVGDLKPMEMNISYFLDMAYDYETWGANGQNKTKEYMTEWVKKQFGSSLNQEQTEGVVSLLQDYTWLNGSCKPEVLSKGTYHVTNYNEAMEMLGRIDRMIKNAETYQKLIPESLQAAYFELVYFPVAASANVARIQIYSGLNEHYYELGSTSANLYAILLEEAVQYDKQLEIDYNTNIPGVWDKWKGMMGSPHVGFITWNSAGWAYPQAKWYKPSGDIQMKVSLQNQNDAYTSGTCTLDDFTNINQESYTVTISNEGGQSFAYTAETSDEWIRISKKSGRVTTQDMLELSVDWSKVSEDMSGTVTITSENNTVTIQVHAKVYDTSGLAEKTYVYANGYASMLAGNFAASGEGTDGTVCKIIENYGKMGQAVKAFPSTFCFADNVGNVPYVDYKVHVDTAGTYKLTVYTAPSNNVDRNDVAIRYGLSVNGGDAEVVHTINSTNYSPGAYSGTWTTDVKENGRKTVSDIRLDAGTNTIRIYAVDPTLVLQKLVVSEEEILTSHFGPSESYYAGKTIGPKTALTDLAYDGYSLPGVINASAYKGSSVTDSTVLNVSEGDSYSYPAIVTVDDTYKFRVSAKSDSGAKLKFYWNDQMIGTVEIGKEDDVYEMDAGMKLKPGYGTLRMTVESGSADITYIRAVLKEKVGVLDVFMSASSEQSGHKAVSAYDGESKTSWSPEESDNEKWIAFNFEEEFYFDRFALTQSGNGVSGYEVQVKDGTEWKTVYTGTDLVNGATVFMQGKEVIKGQELRFVFQGTNIKIAEISITPYTNWAMEDKVTLSGSKKNGESIDVPVSVMDGDRVTKGMEASVGSSENTNRHVVTMEFSQARTIDTVRVISLQEGEAVIPDMSMTSDRAQYSYRTSYYDGSQWQEIGATVRPTNGNPKVFSEFILDEPVAAQAVRLEIYTSNYIRINEFEAVQTQKFRAAIPNTEKEFSQKAKEFEVDLTKELAVGRIEIRGDYADYAFSYYNSEASSYITIPEEDIDIVKTAVGCYAIPADEIHAEKVKVTVNSEVLITDISVYRAASREAECGCRLQKPVIVNDKDVEIPYKKTSKAIALYAEAGDNGECSIEGHEKGIVNYHYSLTDDPDGIAVLNGNLLRFTGEGTAVVRVRAEWNGVVRYGMKVFTVTRANEPPQTYRNHALADNGGVAVISGGEGSEGTAEYMIDGDVVTSSKRWRTKTSPAYVEVYFDGEKSIDSVYFYSQQDGTAVPDVTDEMTTSLAQKNLTFSYMQDGSWVPFEGGTITDNDKVRCGVDLEESVRTPAIRVDIIGTISAYIRVMEVEAYGEAVESDDCICQLGTPVLTSDSTVQISNSSKKGSTELTENVLSYCSGCKVPGHKDKEPAFTYSMISDPDNIASLTGSTLTFSDEGTVTVEVTAELNGQKKSTTQVITAVREGRINFALAANGSTATASHSTSDALNIIDGDNSFSNGKRWRTNMFPSWVEVDFGQSRNITAIHVIGQQDSGNVTPTAGMTGKFALSKMSISYWDGAEWKELEAVTGNDKILYQLKLEEAVTTSKIRIDFPEKICDSWARVVEIEAWGSEGER